MVKEIVTIFKNNLNLKSFNKISTMLDIATPIIPQPINRLNTGVQIKIEVLNSARSFESSESGSLDREVPSPKPGNRLSIIKEEKEIRPNNFSLNEPNIQNWTDYGKLLVLFACNLIAWNQMIDAVKVIETYGFEYKTDQLSLANMHFLLGLVFLRDGSIDSAFSEANTAITLFRKCKSASGLALCYLFESYLSLKDPEESSDLSNTELDDIESKIPKQGK